jgi:hypothetical protein
MSGEQTFVAEFQSGLGDVLESNVPGNECQ